ncbi:type VI secretion-associated protein [Izhakiella australiensis]|uniref:Type VI secretion-associated protein n=1 Tax=Izhakiella australiensis TaxID=1926881 RepID=A0A1S8YQX6_9GAMM|nr:type VI secretion system-associated protein TagF [Izhakiella australiensis]OON41288.1 type VI secretion-associated protein [Izhakiella australiensis]
MTMTRGPGWYGKLPTTGDFIQHRLTETTVSSWFSWIQSGLQTWHQNYSHGNDFLHAPVWNFILPATLGIQRVQLGVMVPSQDRVGRIWPLLAIQSIAVDGWQPSQLNLAHDWLFTLGRLLHDAVNQRQSPQTLASNLAALPALPHKVVTGQSRQASAGQLPWSEAASQFDPHQYTSYWWTQRSEKQPLKTHRHSGKLTAQLFTLLFNPERGAMAGRNGLYPPMFE